MPDPKRSSIVWSKIISYNKLLSHFNVSFNSFLDGIFQIPVKCVLVNFKTSESNLVITMETRIQVTSFDLNKLSCIHFNLHLSCPNFILSSFKLIKSVRNVLSNGDNLKFTLLFLLAKA